MARATKARSINRSTKRGQLTAPPRTADAFFYTLFTDIGGGLQFKCVTHPLKCVCNARCLHHGTYISVPVPLHHQQIEGMVWKEGSHALAPHACAVCQYAGANTRAVLVLGLHAPSSVCTECERPLELQPLLPHSASFCTKGT